MYAICPSCNANLAAGSLHLQHCQFSPTHNIGDAGIEKRLAAEMREAADAVEYLLNEGAGRPRKSVGFCLLVFPMDGFDGRCNYISSARREDVIVLLTEQLARFRGMPSSDGGAKQ